MSTYIKTGFWEKAHKGFKGWLDLDSLIESIAGEGSFANLTGSPSDNIALSTDLDSKLNIVNISEIITDAATIDLSASKQTLTTSSATRTFTISYLGDDITLELILNTTSSVFTFPATSLTVSEGIASGDNTLTLSGASGDRYIIGIKKIGSNYYVVSKNFTQ